MSEQATARLGQIRIGVGLAQGLALYALMWVVGVRNAFTGPHAPPVWPATVHWLYAALWAAVIAGPLILIAGLGQMRRLTLIAWTAIGALIPAGLAAYAVLRNDGGAGPDSFGLLMILAVGAALFIAHCLVSASDAAGRLGAPYPARFDGAWKHAVQLLLSIAFLGAFWLVIGLGVGMFLLIGLKQFGEFVARPWFVIPVNAVAFAAAVHLTDVQAGLTKGIRGVALTLLSWLMPLMGLIAAAFLASLPFTGLAPLWKLTHSTGVLLSAIAALVVLLNAAYQDGEGPTPIVLRWAGRLTALTLLPLTAIAGYGLWLRIAEHGLTPERIIVLAMVTIAAIYALGYAIAAVSPGRWLGAVEPTNLASAYAILAIILALFSPIADPARIAVADQVSRLEAGKIAPADFDYQFLRFKAGNYGRAALKTLAAQTRGAHAAEIAAAAKDALAQTAPLGFDSTVKAKALSADQFTVYPKGAVLPADFLAKPLTSQGGTALDCSDKCETYLVQLGDQPAVIVNEHGFTQLLYLRAPGGGWRIQGQLSVAGCAADGPPTDDLRAGRVSALAPLTSDVAIGGRRYQVQPVWDCSRSSR
jgi:hypothetical protein